jgi:hypothetical protein
VIPLGVGVFAPAVTDDQNNRFSADLRQWTVLFCWLQKKQNLRAVLE